MCIYIYTHIHTYSIVLLLQYVDYTTISVYIHIYMHLCM